MKRDLLPQFLFSLISDGRKVLTVFESILIDPGYGFGERNAGKRGAGGKGFAFNDLNGSGNGKGSVFASRCVLDERLAVRRAKMSINGCIVGIAFGYAEFRNAAGKSTVADLLNRAGDIDAQKLFATAEHRYTNALNGFADHRA